MDKIFIYYVIITTIMALCFTIIVSCINAKSTIKINYIQKVISNLKVMNYRLTDEERIWTNDIISYLEELEKGPRKFKKTKDVERILLERFKKACDEDNLFTNRLNRKIIYNMIIQKY